MFRILQRFPTYIMLGITTILVIGVAVLLLLLSKSSESGNTVGTKCGNKGNQTRTLVIGQDGVAPNHISAKLCDTLVISNKSDKPRLMAFGKHEAHIAYDGVTERYLLKGESFKVTLDKAGTYLVHDHNQEEVGVSFTVSQ